ncbi:MAG: carbonic anhydrase [Alphaproteobacteria bacterium]|nr:carbonic anhydrase [Alphaproteobacteria bacterium]
MRDVDELVDGYRRFLAGRYREEAALYGALAAKGQAPKVMVIACCDSRVDPAAIFSAGPGQLFVVRNVANLVPPFEPHGDYHGTSAALEFAVNGLAVETILVMGHARCGGVRAYLDGIYEGEAQRGFIQRWMSLLKGARTEALREAGDKPIEAQAQALEFAAVRHSIDNLETFPFIKDRLADGRLRLRGAYFDIADGILLALDPDSGAFKAVT